MSDRGAIHQRARLLRGHVEARRRGAVADLDRQLGEVLSDPALALYLDTLRRLLSP